MPPGAIHQSGKKRKTLSRNFTSSGKLNFLKKEGRSLVRKVDYLATQGCQDGTYSLRRASLHNDSPSTLISDISIMSFYKEIKEIYLAGNYPGFLPKQIL